MSLTDKIITLKDFINTDEYKQLSHKKEFPTITSMDDGRLFIETTTVKLDTLSVTQGENIKYLLLDSDLQLRHDAEFEYSQIVPGAHILCLTSPRNNKPNSRLEMEEVASQITIKYIINTEDIKISSYIDSSGNEITTGIESIDIDEVREKLDESLRLTQDNKIALYMKYFDRKF